MIKVPVEITQLALSASNDARRAQVFLTGYCTPEGVAQAEAARKRALQALRDLGHVLKEERAKTRSREQRSLTTRQVEHGHSV